MKAAVLPPVVKGHETMQVYENYQPVQLSVVTGAVEDLIRGDVGQCVLDCCFLLSRQGF